MLIAELVSRLHAMPALLEDCAQALPRPEWTRQPGPGLFSLVEHCCHLRDLEEEGYTLRIRRLLREENPLLADFDGAAVARARDYRRQDLSLALNALDLARRQNVAVLTELPAEAFRRRGRMGDAEVTLERLTAMMLEHDASHRQELEDLFTALGR